MNNLSSKIQSVVNNTTRDQSYFINEKITSNENLVIFGAGNFGQAMAKNLFKANQKVMYFIDNDEKKHGNFISGVEVVSLDRVLSLTEDTLIIICSTWHIEIKKQLLKANITNFIEVTNAESSKYLYKFSEQREVFTKYYKENEEKFEKVYNLFEDSVSKELFISLLAYRISGNTNCLKMSQFEQYEHHKVRPELGDIIIDGGGFIGDTSEQFIQLLDGNCLIHSFEPLESNIKEMKQWIKNNGVNNVTAVQAGLGIEKNDLFMNPFEGEVNPGYSIVEQGTEKVMITSIDEYVIENKIKVVNLIKLDIEGFELSALQGADKTIKNCIPKIQVCLYHEKEDLIEIPLYIYNTYKEQGYKFYLGHHMDNYMETVLYLTNK